MFFAHNRKELHLLQALLATRMRKGKAVSETKENPVETPMGKVLLGSVSYDGQLSFLMVQIRLNGV